MNCKVFVKSWNKQTDRVTYKSCWLLLKKGTPTLRKWLLVIAKNLTQFKGIASNLSLCWQNIYNVTDCIRQRILLGYILYVSGDTEWWTSGCDDTGLPSVEYFVIINCTVVLHAKLVSSMIQMCLLPSGRFGSALLPCCGSSCELGGPDCWLTSICLRALTDRGRESHLPCTTAGLQSILTLSHPALPLWAFKWGPYRGWLTG